MTDSKLENDVDVDVDVEVDGEIESPEKITVLPENIVKLVDAYSMSSEHHIIKGKEKKELWIEMILGFVVMSLLVIAMMCVRNASSYNMTIRVIFFVLLSLAMITGCMAIYSAFSIRRKNLAQEDSAHKGEIYLKTKWPTSTIRISSGKHFYSISGDCQEDPRPLLKAYELMDNSQKA